MELFKALRLISHIDTGFHCCHSGPHNFLSFCFALPYLSQNQRRDSGRIAIITGATIPRRREVP